jgi:hypothetical protein
MRCPISCIHAAVGIPLQQSPAFQQTADAQCEGLSQSGELGARRRLHPAESEQTVGALDIHPIQKQHVGDPIRISGDGTVEVG